MKPQYPYKGHYYVSQPYAAKSTKYASGQHDGLDIVPLDKPGGNHWPAPIFPILGGKTLSVSNTDLSRGKGIRVRTLLSAPFVQYLKDKGVIPKSYDKLVFLNHLYWHCLMVTDLDGTIDQSTPVAITGNTGYVFAGGVEVPAYQKGKPPYPGLHLHLETELESIGRIDPQIILDYSGDSMGQLKTQQKGSELRVVIPAEDINDWKNLCEKFGLNPDKVDEKIN